MKATLTQQQINQILKFQKAEITEYHIYNILSKKTKDVHNAQILQQIADEEHRHYNLLKRYTQLEVKPSKVFIAWYRILSMFFGITFTIKLMEGGENKAQGAYNEISDQIAEVEQILNEEKEHENKLIDLIDEERLRYAGSMVLGLNDALVELTGTLAGLSLALQNTRLIAMAGLITGIAASFSMAASEYLSQKAEELDTALKSATYTGIAYIVTVAILILPYLIFDNYFLCLGMTLSFAILIILVFNYYISVAKSLNFKRRFIEMALISLGVATLSFFVGFVVKRAFGIDL